MGIADRLNRRARDHLLRPRARVALAVLVAAVAWLATAGPRADRALRGATREVLQRVVAGENDGDLARPFGTYHRLLDNGGVTIGWLNRDGADRLDQIVLGWLLEPLGGDRAIEDLEAARGPTESRPEVQAALRGEPSSGCYSAADRRICWAVGRVNPHHLLYVAKSRRVLVWAR